MDRAEQVAEDGRQHTDALAGAGAGGIDEPFYHPGEFFAEPDDGPKPSSS